MLTELVCLDGDELSERDDEQLSNAVCRSILWTLEHPLTALSPFKSGGALSCIVFRLSSVDEAEDIELVELEVGLESAASVLPGLEESLTTAADWLGCWPSLFFFLRRFFFKCTTISASVILELFA